MKAGSIFIVGLSKRLLSCAEGDVQAESELG